MGKICRGCRLRKPLEDFYKSPKGAQGRQSCCIPCHNRRSKEWAKANPEKRNSVEAKSQRKKYLKLNAAKISISKRAWRLMKEYGWMESDYRIMLDKQKGVCAICKIPQKNLLYIDHDHKTGKIRGLLCPKCNHGLGNFKDSIDFLKEAILYLSR